MLGLYIKLYPPYGVYVTRDKKGEKMKYFKKEYFNKNDIKHYLKYGPMDFTWPQAFTYYIILELPSFTFLYIIIKVVFK